MARAFSSPLGPIRLAERDGAIVGLDWRGADENADSPLIARAGAQLAEYFAGERQVFDLPLTVDGSDFQRAVCDAMLAIPLGETRTYGEIAVDLGASAQAVGNACGANPIPIIIPCHRVLGANSLGGFSGAGGVESKVWLLRHEGAAGLLI
ncbi:MAG TPA: methylated-DNA--[protein]-cysteine S-methyltransferase [Rhodobacterales bacterium]|nr:methylated-DNA--[protein]-cysteine S-methyltransferase [Rhodobacterales bacterium]